MRLTKKFWIGSLIAASMMLAAVSSGQPSPTLKANNARTGVNADPLGSSPGRAFLTWFRPNLNDAMSGTIVRNNTAVAPNVAFTAGFLPAPASFLAAFYYDQPSFGDQAADMATGAFANYPPVFDGRTPEYRYATTVAASSIDDPRVGSTQTFTWSMDPTTAPINQPGTGTLFARNYALYVWLPIGATTTGLGRQFPQRYYVYEIQYGPAASDVYIEVIDTYAAGAGWVRLGNAGNDSNRMFPYNGTFPIQIRLHNTVPLNAEGFPSDVVGTTLVYADAALAVPQAGVMNATPTVSSLPTGVPGVGEGRAIAAVNRLSLGQREGQTVTVSQGEVRSYSYANGSFDSAATGTRWVFRPADQVFTVTMDNLVANNSGFTSNPVGPGSASALGTDYLTAPLVTTPGPATAAVTYAPTLEDGEYQIQMYLAPDTVAQQFGQAVDVEIHEGATVTTLTINMNRGPGWYPIGTTRYRHTELENLRFVVTNVGSAADVLAGRLAYADAVRFVGAFDVEVNSTPTSARVFINTAPEPAPPVLEEREVVIVCADDGRIYCLDAYGNADGTTNVYWAYPSIPDPNNPGWTDPNIEDTNFPVGHPNRNIDGNGGVTIAEMPIGFGRSSPVVQRVAGEDFVFIAARNGRVYSISTAGRGDFDFATQRPGTTRRQWSYPNDYPRPRQAGSLGSFSNASLAYAEVGGTPRLYVPTESGHMLALNPFGNPANRITNVLWDFPGRTAQIAPVTTTPAIFNGRIYFGTTLDSAGAGHFYSVDAASGSTATAQEFIPTPTLGDPDPPALGAFFGGPAAVAAADIGGIGAVDTIYVANNNLNVYALDATNINNVIWRTDELNTTVTGPLTFTHLSVYELGGTIGMHPVVVVPGESGQWSALLARGGLPGPGVTNRFDGKFVWGNIAQGNIVAGTSVGNPIGQAGFLFGGDTNGNLFAFSNTNTLPDQGTPPIQEIIPPDDPAGDAWRDAKIKILPNRIMYDDLRSDPSSINYGTINALPDAINPAFEWGQTVYFVVYDFPYADTLNGDPALSPALVNIQISTEGAASRQFSVVARQFTQPPPAPAQRDGYAVLAFAIQGSGPNSLPPGRGRVTYTVTPARSSTGQQAQVAQNRNSFLAFQVANPIGVAVGPSVNEQIGVTPVTTDPGALVNGTPNLASTPLNNESLLTTFFGVVGHATTGNAVVQIYDRSLMTFLRGPGRGVDQVRVGRQELEWLGGSAAIIKPIPPFFGPLFEDLPDDRPNISLDYPNIRAENLRATKDPNGQAENPIYSGVFLRPPTNPSGLPLTEDDTPGTRLLVPTPLLLEVDVPRFQPANFGQAWTSSTGANIPSGYSGRVSVFVDSNNDGQLNTISGRLEANRGFWLNGSVSIDEAIEVRTPTVDLGSLPGGAGYSPARPGLGAGPFNPWTGSAEMISMFKSFVVENPGNVNLINLRLAKATNQGGDRLSWGIFSSSVDELAWVDAGVGLWSDIDSVFARTPQVIAQKPRVGDRSAAVLQTNPNMRPNPNLDTAGGRFLPAPFSDNPRVAVTLPIGFPVGTYSQVMRIIEDANGDESLALSGNNALEAFSDPTFNLILKVRETRLTNNHTRLTAPMVDEAAILGSDGAAFLHQNLQPTAARVSAGSDIGHLLVAWTSSRPADVAVQPTNASGNDQFRIFLAGLNGGNLNPDTRSDGNNGVRDLTGFLSSTASKWFTASPDSANGYPGLGYIYPTSAGETLVAGTAKYGGPALPSRGQVNTVAGIISQPAQFVNFDMPFVGEAQKQTPSGRVSESRLFITRVTQTGGAPAIEASPYDMPFDIYSQKGRPSAVRIGDLLASSIVEDLTFVTYSALSAGNSRIYWTMFDYNTRTDADTHGWMSPQPINFGDGFESVASPSVTLRPYVGQGGHGLAVYDISFTGKLRGRRNSEVFQGRLPFANPSNPVDYPRIFEEVLTPDSETGVFRARGVDWNLNLPTPPHPVLLGLRNAAGVTIDIEVPNTRAFDQATGLVTFNTTLGGKAYLDPRMGTVRLSSGLPLSTQQLVLTYTPKFLRVSTGTTAGYSGVSQFHDSRLDGISGQNTKYWARPSGSGIDGTDTPRVHRFFLNYNRAAAGAGQAARPFMKTMRLGVQLPHQLHTDQNGNITGLAVAGVTDYFQVDPVKGRIYFSPADEDRVVNITYSAMDQSTGAALPGFTFGGTVTLVPEMDETPVPIEQAVNESNLYAFPDPFDSTPGFLRPNLVWMFWSSTRGGSPDLYFQTVAPRFAPQPSGN